MATHIRLRGTSRKGGFLRRLFSVLFIAALLALGVAVFTLFEFQKPELTLGKHPTALGGKIELPLTVTDAKSGIRSLTITLRQNQTDVVLLQRTFPRAAWFGPAGPRVIEEQVPIDPGTAGISEGQAELIVEVRDFSLAGFFRGNRTKKVLPVTMDTKPPVVSVVQSQHAIRPGGSGVVVYSVGEQPARHGVMVDTTLFPGHPTGKPGFFVAYFALPWDAQQPKSVRVAAWDEAGNEGSAPCAVLFKKAAAKHDTITISDNFLQQKMPEFAQHYPEMRGTLLEQYLYVNREVRQKNAEAIDKLCARTDPQQLWQGRFLRMPGANRAGFADQRTYLYQGREIDRQTHLGIDIASVANAEIRAANRGRVVFADYMGIYGNMVLIDHGQGVASLYSHLNDITTTAGALVEKNQPIGHSGTSGMAGGDHLHFSMLVQGVFVTPIEWWDQHWIDVNITPALNAAR
ncbi:MAG: M23 family metallopeptidase [Desulfobulbus sp.]|jgi:murein DD-endopeptidase MepM/ murein hydrolase activator NlpD